MSGRLYGNRSESIMLLAAMQVTKYAGVLRRLQMQSMFLNDLAWHYLQHVLTLHQVGILARCADVVHVVHIISNNLTIS